MSKPTKENAPKITQTYGEVLSYEPNTDGDLRLEMETPNGDNFVAYIPAAYNTVANRSGWITEGKLVCISQETRIKDETTYTDKDGKLHFHGENMKGTESIGFAGIRRCTQRNFDKMTRSLDEKDDMKFAKDLFNNLGEDAVVISQIMANRRR